jgi:hypothetical protein
MVTEAMEYVFTTALCNGCSREKQIDGKHSIEALIEFFVQRTATAGRLLCLFWCSFSKAHTLCQLEDALLEPSR